MFLIKFLPVCDWQIFRTFSSVKFHLRRIVFARAKTPENACGRRSSKFNLLSTISRQWPGPSTSRTYHRCNKKPLNTIKTLHRLGMLSRAPQLWEKMNFYIIIIKNLWTFSTFFAFSRVSFFILKTSKKFSQVFVFSLLQPKKEVFLSQKRAALPYRYKKWWEE